MKLSNLIACLNHVADTDADPDVHFMVGADTYNPINAVLTGRCEVSIERGDLSACPEWEQKLVITMQKEVDEE